MVRRKRLLIVLLGLSLLALPMMARAYRVTGSSDVPSFLDGDLVLVNQAAYAFRLPFRESPLLTWASPVRGDVVLFRLPGSERPVFKTVIGLPGERLEVHAGLVTIDGRALRYGRIAPSVPSQKNTAILPGSILARERGHDLDHLVVISPADRHFHPVQIPEDHYFLLGSNRAVSIDSRHFGPAPRHSIRGKIYLNLSDLWRRAEL
ncbi:MAG TPA: signal peptidase I [Thermoanaerobaculia bacterium]|nr:signal peptidase I [Thermoanaerobaculia bacterium]